MLQLKMVTIQPGGAAAALALEGYSEPLVIYVGVAEAAAILDASSYESRRPSTIAAWQSSLKVQPDVPPLEQA